MSFSFLVDLSESKVFPAKADVLRTDDKTLAELAYCYILGLVVLLSFKDTEKWARQYCGKTIESAKFDNWHSSANDLFCVLYGLNKLNYKINGNKIHDWLHDVNRSYLGEHETSDLLLKLDSWFKIKDETLRATRRLTQNFSDLNRNEKKLVVSKLIKELNIKPKSEILEKLKQLSDTHSLEVTNPKKENSFLSSLSKHKFKENASSGSTASANVATVVGGLGSGFSNDYSKSIYGPQKVIRREPIKEDDIEEIEE